MIILKPKKKIYLGLLFSLMIGIFSIGITNTYASENSNFNINSQPIEEQAINFAKTDFEHSITSILLMENNTETDINYTLGSPFKMLDGENTANSSIFFPVFSDADNTIKYVYTVKKNTNGEYSGSISQFLAKELQNLVDSNITDTTLFFQDNSIYYSDNGQIKLLWKSPLSTEKNGVSSLTEKNDLISVNIKNKIKNFSKKQNFPAVKRVKSVSSGDNFIMINWRIAETQTSFPWCAAYVEAAILCNKTDVRATSARAIMHYTYPNLNNSQIESKSLNQDQIIKYANYCGVYPKKIARILNLSEVQTQLRKGNAIYMGTAGYGNYSNSRHALALFGWVNQGGYQTYYVWNPWYNYPTVISANAGPVTIPVPGGGFTWDNT
ncbi:TPA: C47 family peptidase, partial [Enterococcus faecium]